MIRFAAFLAVVLVCLVGRPAAASAQLSIEMMGGTGYNIPTPLTVRQAGFPAIRLLARYDTKPLGPYAPYYSWRVGWWNEGRAWELQHVHHRLFLANTTAEIQSFAIHYGYNYFLIGRAWRRGDFVLHVGAGIVVTSPESTIRGRSLNTRAPGVFDIGYDLSGVGAQVAISRSWPVVKHLDLLADVGVLAGSASVPVEEGSASAPNVGIHGRVGIGFTLWR